MVYLDTPHVRVWWDDEARFVGIEWRAYVEGPTYREPLNLAIELMKEKKTSKMLSDMRRMKAVTQADQEWVNKDWLPRAIAAGSNCTAMVVPESAVAMMSLNRIMGKVGKVVNTGETSAYFKSMEEAKQWLASKP